MSAAVEVSHDRLPRVSMIPVLRLMDEVGIVEHSNGSVPDPSQGHCTDDAGRALGLAASLPRDLASAEIAERCLAQLQRSMVTPGRFVLRLDMKGRPTDHPDSDDATARALWGLSLAATSTLPQLVRDWSTELLREFRSFQTPFPRAAAHAVIAGSNLVKRDLSPKVGEDLLLRNVQYMPRTAVSRTWVWPETRLTYGNGLLAESLLHAGQVLGNAQLVSNGLDQLSWLVAHETSPLGHFSFTPTGNDRTSRRSNFDQQPLEAWTTASACSTALSIDLNRVWVDAIERAADWFAGRNDGNIPVWDHENGAAFDGLTADGVNYNEGAESTLAFIGTLIELERVRNLVGPSPIRLAWPKPKFIDG